MRANPDNAHDCEVNAVDPAELFKWYELSGFLYPSKKARLAPLWPAIETTWCNLLKWGDSLLAVVTHRDGPNWASVCGWRSTHRSWQYQHLVSAGNIVGTRAVLLAGLSGRLKDDSLSIQQWFRADNRFPQRVLGSMVRSIGPEHSSVSGRYYLSFPMSSNVTGTDARVEPITDGQRSGLYDFARSVCGDVYAQAEELDHDDLLLENLDAQYRRARLRRYRRIWLAYLPGRTTPSAAAIAYRGPIGLNFSLLENRCELLMDQSINEGQIDELTRALVNRVVLVYDGFPHRAIPVVADQCAAAAITRCGAELIRPYQQGIFLREGYEAYLQHVNCFYGRVIRSHHRRGLGACPAAGSHTVEQHV